MRETERPQAPSSYIAMEALKWLANGLRPQNHFRSHQRELSERYFRSSLRFDDETPNTHAQA